jgi:hypothetical protein
MNNQNSFVFAEAEKVKKAAEAKINLIKETRTKNIEKLIENIITGRINFIFREWFRKLFPITREQAINKLNKPINEYGTFNLMQLEIYRYYDQEIQMQNLINLADNSSDGKVLLSADDARELFNA